MHVSVELMLGIYRVFGVLLKSNTIRIRIYIYIYYRLLAHSWSVTHLFHRDGCDCGYVTEKQVLVCLCKQKSMDPIQSERRKIMPCLCRTNASQ